MHRAQTFRSGQHAGAGFQRASAGIQAAATTGLLPAAFPRQPTEVRQGQPLGCLPTGLGQLQALCKAYWKLCRVWETELILESYWLGVLCAEQCWAWKVWEVKSECLVRIEVGHRGSHSCGSTPCATCRSNRALASTLCTSMQPYEARGC